MQPKLYNWVRAIKNISFISAIYTSLVLVASVIIFFATQLPEGSQKFPYFTLAALVLTVLFTIFVRSFSSKRLAKKIKTNLSFELLLASWCILLILIHLQCQLLFLILFRAPISAAFACSVFAFGALIIYLTWPKLKQIQSLLSNNPL